MIHRADDELRPIHIVERPTRFLGATLELFQRIVIVARRNTIIQDRSIGDFAGELHHLRPGRADIDRHIARLTPAMDNVQLNAIDVVEFTMECHPLHVQQAPQDIHRLAHRQKRLTAVDADVARQGVPPCADAADDAIRRQVI